MRAKMTKAIENDSRDGWYDITPAIAAELRESFDKNRPLRAFHAAWLAVEMKSGRWCPNGEALIIAGDRLVNGQHRSRAAEISGATFRSYVIFLPATSSRVFESFDQGARRTGADVLSLGAVKNQKLVAAVVRALILYEEPGDRNATSGTRKVGNAEIAARYRKDHAAFDDCASAIQKNSKALKSLIPASVAAFVVYMAAKQNATRAAAFLDGVVTGNNLSKTNPVLLLRKRVMEAAVSKAKLPPAEILALMTVAWRAFRDQRELKVLKWDSRGSFPRFEDKGEGAK